MYVNMFIVLCITARPFMPSELFNINCTYNLIFDIKENQRWKKHILLAMTYFLCVLYVCMSIWVPILHT